MKIFAPDYFRDFKCSAGKCKHSCCIGWEIDIDSETAEFYKSVPGEFGKKLSENIDFSEEGGTFHLCENERCPFLNEKNLCEIYINLGEKALSQICDDHPRFRNYLESRTEIGLGLCCEEAAKLVLEKKSKTEIIEIGDDGEPFYDSEEEEKFLESRKKLFEIFQNREKSIEKRISDAFGLFGAKTPEMDFGKWAEICLSLERLDESWTGILESIAKNPAPPENFDETAAEQLLCYFIFRHYKAEYPLLSLCYCVLSFYFTKKAAEQVGILEGARLWSSEIEYSDENEDIILDKIFEEMQQ
ncbi:MAG: flagellin lysine-N-methylase [Oscillospiraceae bacterium]|nr:flagellin lysine-N-methylase [Oscillospiraceae bacterium]MBR6657022.1 flagellin lysine-N-methylase [Oscillospiraceae bacterium]